MQLEAAASALKGRNDDYDPTRRMSTGEFLQVAGLRFDIDLGEPAAAVDNRRLVSPGSRVKNIAVDSSRGWVPLEDDKIYSVAALDYTVKHWNVLSSVPAGRTAIACFDRYLAEVLRRRADPKTDGRINIIN